MNKDDKKYTDYALCREMLETPGIFRNFNPRAAEPFLPRLEGVDRILLTGEGSSRIFPAKGILEESNISPGARAFFTEGSTQAMEYDLSGCAVFGASNSGRTKELLRLFHKLKENEGTASIPLVGITASGGSPLTEIADASYVLSCGGEEALAATKSVAEQALFYQSLAAILGGRFLIGLDQAAEELKGVLELPVDPALVGKFAQAPRIYFAGRNNGVAEELTLKCNEITRKPSVFLEGTYLLHGIEEVMEPQEALVLIDPFPEEEKAIQKRLAEDVGLTILAVASRKTSFPTLKIPSGGAYRRHLELAAGWNLLVEIGLACGTNLDTSVRARKVGNEFEGLPPKPKEG